MLTLVTPTFKPKQQQITKFLVVDGGLTYLAFGQVIDIKYAKQVQEDFKGAKDEERAKIVRYSTALRRLLLKTPSIANKLPNTHML